MNGVKTRTKARSKGGKEEEEEGNGGKILFNKVMTTIILLCIRLEEPRSSLPLRGKRMQFNRRSRGVTTGRDCQLYILGRFIETRRFLFLFSFFFFFVCTICSSFSIFGRFLGFSGRKKEKNACDLEICFFPR